MLKNLVHPSTKAQGEREISIDYAEDFPFVLRLSKHERFFSRIKWYMRIAIHQPNYLPWCGYFYKMGQVDLFVILDDCSFTKSGVTHRVRIRTPQGTGWLTVPVGKKEVPIVDLSPDQSQDWGTRHWNIIKNAYASAAFWSEVVLWLEPTVRRKWQKLVDLNVQGIRQVAAFLGIETPIFRASELPEEVKQTLGLGSERNLGICKYFRAKTYVSGQGARDYNDERAFAAAGIGLEYIQFKHPVYPQLGEGFIPGLSIIDLLFNCGPKSRDVLFQLNGDARPPQLRGLEKRSRL